MRITSVGIDLDKSTFHLVALVRCSLYSSRSGCRRKTICWLMPGDVVVDTSRHYWVRKRGAEGARYAAQRYSVGLERNFGVKFQAI